MSASRRTVNMFEAKTQLSRLVEALETGAADEIVIARNGRPVARLIPLRSSSPRRLGLQAGRFPAPSLDDFNADDKHIAAALFGAETDR